MPIGEFIKVGAKALKYAKSPISKAAKELVGEEVGGRIIKSVTRGVGDWRYLVFEDGSAMPVKRMILNDLIRNKTTVSQVAEFTAKESEGQLAQAYKSLEFHKSRVYGGHTRQSMELFHKSYTDNLKALGKTPPDLSMVSHAGKNFIMPSEYANLLEKEGTLKVVKRLK